MYCGEGGGFGWGPPPPRVLPMVPAKTFEASILLAQKAPKQNFGCQPQTLEGEERGGGVPLFLRCAAVLIHRRSGR